MSNYLRPHGLQHARLPCPSPTPRACSNPCPSSWWCHPTISSSVVPFSSHLQSFPASGSFPRGQLFASGGQSIGVSVSASVLPMNIQDWFHFGSVSLQSKGHSRVFSNTSVQKHQFFGIQLSLLGLVHAKPPGTHLYQGLSKASHLEDYDMFTQTFCFCVSQAPEMSRSHLFSEHHLLLTRRSLGEAFKEEKAFALTKSQDFIIIQEDT